MPGAVVPLRTLTLQFHKTCAICLDDEFDADGGCKCSGDGHFLCWPCLERYVDDAHTVDAIKRTVDDDGGLRCPECEATFTLIKVASQAAQLEALPDDDAKKQASKGVFSGLQKLKTNSAINKVLPSELEAQEKRLRSEFERIEAIRDEDERKVQRLRHLIINDILVLKCPKCSCAFNEFDGCYALTCANQGCRVQFCAWCLDHWDARDCHHHVATCPQASRAGYYHSIQVFKEHHSKRRKARVVSGLKGEPRDVRNRVLAAMHVDLTDLNIRLNDADFG